jgi:hypothetical protein
MVTTYSVREYKNILLKNKISDTTGATFLAKGQSDYPLEKIILHSIAPELACFTTLLNNNLFSKTDYSGEV